MRLYRKEKKLSVEELSTITGISEKHLRKYERGEKKPVMENWDKIARAIGCGLPELASRSNMQLVSSRIQYTENEQKLLEEYYEWKYSDQQPV